MTAIALHIRRVGLALAGAFAAVVLAAGFWGLARQETLLARGDNPRRVLAERRVPRGPIYDRHGAVLAESAGAAGALARRYPYPRLAPVLGYVSALYGLTGVEAALDPTLHGDAGLDPTVLFWQTTVLGAPPAGRGVRLSVDLALQATADTALGERAGAALLLDAVTGEILVMASHPTFDANTLEDHWDALVGDEAAPLLNRATMGLYQPGGALWPLVIGLAAETDPAALAATFPTPTRTVAVNGAQLGCRVDPRLASLTLQESLLFGCPGPIAALGDELGAETLRRGLAEFGLTMAPALDIPTAAGTEAAGSETVEQIAIGQGKLTISPLQLALVTAAIARGGLAPAPQLVLAAQNPDGIWRPAVPAGPTAQVLEPEAARRVKPLLRNGYGAIALTGAAGRRLAWYAGFEPYAEARYVVVVLLEDGGLSAAAEIGRALLRAAAP